MGKFQINMWTNEFQTIKSETRPVAEDENEGRFFPIVSMSRVHGSKYSPYRSGSDAWRKAANEALANHARSNFERGKR